MASGDGVHYAPRHPSTMARDITFAGREGFEPPTTGFGDQGSTS